MKFISIAMVDREHPPHADPEQMERMAKLLAELRAEGVLVDTGGRDDDMMEFTVTFKNGRTTVVDGPFTESKEFVGGFALFDVADRNEALAVTNRFLETLDSKGTVTCHLHEVSPTP